MRAVFLALAIVLGLCGCRSRKVALPAPPPPPATPANTLVAGTVIKGKGTWFHKDGDLVHNLTVSKVSKLVNWKYRITGPKHGLRNQGASCNAAVVVSSSSWFIYAEYPDRLWVHDGRGNLTCHTWEGNSGSATLGAIIGGKLELDEGAKPVPADVIFLLPPDLQELFPEADRKPRPSI